MNWLKPSYRKRSAAATLLISLAISLSLSIPLLGETVAQTTHEVKITGFAFVPQNLIIKPGDTVVWNNTDPVMNTLWFVFVANGSTYLLSDPIPPDSTWSYTFNDAVELQYYSFDKLWMTGFLTVTTEVHDIALPNVVLNKTIVGEGYSMNLSVTVVNQGDFDETFNVTLYANITEIETRETTLLTGNSTTIPFTWNTTGFTKGNYTIWAYAWPVTGETYTENNNCTGGSVLVNVPGDVSGPTHGVPDGVVNIRDINYLVQLFMTKPGSPNWNPNADINNDGVVNIRDVNIAVQNFNKKWP